MKELLPTERSRQRALAGEEDFNLFLILWLKLKTAELSQTRKRKQKESSCEPQPLNPGCRSSSDPSHTPRALHIKHHISHQPTKYKLGRHTTCTLKIQVWAWLLSVSHNYCVTLVARRARLVLHRGCCRLTSISRAGWEISQREAE